MASLLKSLLTLPLLEDSCFSLPLDNLFCFPHWLWLPWWLPPSPKPSHHYKSIFCQMVWLPKPWCLLVHTYRDVSLRRERCCVWGSITTRWRSELHRRGSWPIKTVSESWARLSAQHMIDGLSLGNTYCIDINADEIQIQKTSMSVFQKLKPLSKNRLCLIH